MRDNEPVNQESGSADNWERCNGGRIDRTGQLIRCPGKREREESRGTPRSFTGEWRCPPLTQGGGGLEGTTVGSFGFVDSGRQANIT